MAQAQNPPANFRDVPAGHWAREAVEYITQRGLIQGFPDGTFRGNENLTRYQAALIFYRLLQSGALSQVPPQDQGMIQQGMQQVQAELAALQKRLAALEEASAAQDKRLASVEQQVQQLAGRPTPDTTELTNRIAALEQQVKSLGGQPTQTPQSDALAARIAALEEQVQKLSQAPAQPAPAAGPDLTPRVTALEGQVQQLSQANTAQAQRIAALEQQVKSLQADLAALRQQSTAPAPAPAPAPTPSPAPAPVTESTPAPLPSVYLGIGAAYPAITTNPVSSNFTDNLSVSATIGLRDLFLGFGPRLGVDYRLSNNNLALELNFIRSLNPGGFFDPYLGLGARVDLSAPGDILANTYGNSVVGFGLNFSRNLGLFAEANPRFEQNLQFGLGARAGLKVSF
ncbi:S-layer protein [Meiothermus sp. PNK-Is4]|nr:S-layer protein [Meiothermus sp. Pnk-1]RYM32682.1 S-layer protein [Meiothermus sp. PNK-Is4]